MIEGHVRGGLVAAAPFLGTAIRLRRYRGPI